MPSSSGASPLRQALVRDGYALVPGVLNAGEIEAVDAAARALLDAAPAAHFQANRTTGSMLSVASAPSGFEPLICHPRTLELLGGLGYGQVKFSAGYVISKPAGAPRLFWHQDWLYWDQPISWDETPHQIFAMFYLVDTHRSNGCLRVIPGSHRRRLPAHDQLLRAHSKDALAGTALAHPTFGDLPGEIDVPVRAGDLLLGDSRLLHAAHANNGSERRTLITLWYHPAYERLPAPIRASMRSLSNADRLTGALSERLRALLPDEEQLTEPATPCREPRFPDPAMLATA